MKKSRNFCIRLLLLVAVVGVGCIIGSIRHQDSKFALIIATLILVAVAINYCFDLKVNDLYYPNGIYAWGIGGIIGYLKPNILIYSIIIALAILSLALIFFGYTGHETEKTREKREAREAKKRAKKEKRTKKQ